VDKLHRLRPPGRRPPACLEHPDEVLEEEERRFGSEDPSVRKRTLAYCTQWARGATRRRRATRRGLRDRSDPPADGCARYFHQGTPI